MSISELLSMADSDQASFYSVSTNATADNLPGTGRTLGLIYSFAGRHLEVQLGRLAERLGRGPRATAFRIQENSKIVSHAYVWPVSVVKSITKEIEKDCRLLLKYVGSIAPSTREQALNHIIDLSFDDEYVRGLLKAMGAVRLIEGAQEEIFLRSDYDASLLSRSREALVSVNDDMLKQVIKLISEPGGTASLDRLKIIRSYARDPDRSFIVVRCFVHFIRDYGLFSEENFIDCTAIDTAPEWDCLDQAFYDFLKALQKPRQNSRDYAADWFGRIQEIIIKHADKLPRTVGSETFQLFMEDRPFMKDHALCTVSVLRSFARQNSTVKEDFSCIDWNHIRDLYPHSSLRPLFARLLSKPNLMFYQIVHERMGDNSSSYDVSWVVESETLMRLSQELALFTDSEDQLLSSRARHCVTSLLVMDIYCRTAILRALSTTRYARSPEFVQSTRTQQVRNSAVNNDYLRAFYRYCDADGKLIHVCESPIDAFGIGCTGEKKYCLKIDDEAVLKLRVQRGEAFSSVGHYPIVAGCTTNGELAYLAVSHYSKIHSQHIFAVTEGMKPESLRLRAWDSHSNSWRMRTPESFVVYVLRYEPAAYARNGRYGSEGLDPTGPFSWRPVRQEYSPLSDMWVEEAQIVSEGSGSDEEAWDRDNEGNESDEDAWETFYGGSLFPSD